MKYKKNQPMSFTKVNNKRNNGKNMVIKAFAHLDKHYLQQNSGKVNNRRSCPE